ncbi:MAG: cation-transporting P-type ATPase [Vicinamibacterales bacterium]|nr:cation-transporting P-type ATPase [Vicinamibacterales bacterium]
MSEPRPTSAPSPAEAWYHRSADDALTHFSSSASGLSATEAARRLAANGPNVFTEATRIGA